MKQVQEMQAAAQAEILWQEPDYDLEEAVRQAREDHKLCNAIALGVAALPAIVLLAPVALAVEAAARIARAAWRAMAGAPAAASGKEAAHA